MGTLSSIGAMPRVLAPLKRLWLKLGHVLHVVVSPVILTAVYLLVFIPVGAIIRLFGKDLLGLKHDRGRQSYWIERTGGPAPESLKDQF
jgi:saxitoxin biosynthesis operon SxtJ-like protein